MMQRSWPSGDQSSISMTVLNNRVLVELAARMIVDLGDHWAALELAAEAVDVGVAFVPAEGPVAGDVGGAVVAELGGERGGCWRRGRSSWIDLPHLPAYQQGVAGAATIAPKRGYRSPQLARILAE